MFIIRLLKLIGRELKMLAADRRLFSVTLLVPILYTVLLGSIYLQKRVTAIPTWMINTDNSQLSRTITQSIANSETFKIVKQNGTLDEFREATRRGEAFACIVIPDHFERDVKHSRAVRILTVIDGSNMLIANSAIRGITEIATIYSVGVQMKKLAMHGTPGSYTLGNAIPIESASRVWYNPAFNYMDFLLPGLIATIIQQVALLSIALAFTRENDKNIFSQALAISHSPLELLTAKTFVYTTINIITAGGSFLLGVKMFGLSIAGSPGLFMLLLALFIFSLVAMGILVAMVTRDQLFTTQILMLIAVPSFLMSGFTWPQIAMTPIVLSISNILPLTHFVLPMRQIITQGSNFNIIAPHLRWLWIFSAICYTLAYLIIWKMMRKANKEAVAIAQT